MTRFSKRGVIFAVFLVFCSLAADAKIPLRMSTRTPAASPDGAAFQRLAKLLEERSKGELSVTLYHGIVDGKKVGELDLIRKVMAGALEVTISTTAPLENVDPKLAVFNLPYLFQDYDHVTRVLDGPIGESMLAHFLDRAKKVRGLAYWDNGFRNLFTTNRPVYAPQDVEQLRIRVMQSAAYMQFVSSMGGVPVPTSVTEVYDKLQKGVVDGGEIAYPHLVFEKFYEVIKYVTETRHFYSPKLVLINEAFYQNLPKHLQQLVKDLILETGQFQRAKFREDDLKSKAICVKAGIKILTLTDDERDAFRKATARVYDQLAPLVGADLIDRIRRAAR